MNCLACVGIFFKLVEYVMRESQNQARGCASPYCMRYRKGAGGCSEMCSSKSVFETIASIVWAGNNRLAFCSNIWWNMLIAIQFIHCISLEGQIWRRYWQICSSNLGKHFRSSFDSSIHPYWDLNQETKQQMGADRFAGWQVAALKGKKKTVKNCPKGNHLFFGSIHPFLILFSVMGSPRWRQVKGRPHPGLVARQSQGTETDNASHSYSHHHHRMGSEPAFFFFKPGQWAIMFTQLARVK